MYSKGLTMVYLQSTHTIVEDISAKRQHNSKGESIFFREDSTTIAANSHNIMGVFWPLRPFYPYMERYKKKRDTYWIGNLISVLRYVPGEKSTKKKQKALASLYLHDKIFPLKLKTNKFNFWRQSCMTYWISERGKGRLDN